MSPSFSSIVKLALLAVCWFTVVGQVRGQAVTILHQFGDGSSNGPDGTGGQSTLVVGADGNFYGTTSAGGANAEGNIYKVDSQGNVTVLYSFGSTANDGTNPTIGGLLQGMDGNLYGTTQNGGTNGTGTVFRISLQGEYEIMHSFGSGTVNDLNGDAVADGANPGDTVIQCADGNFYGTTQNGGSASLGCVYRISSQGQVTILHSFGDGTVANDGANPVAALVQGKDGNLYGTTLHGGPYVNIPINGVLENVSFGTFFKITLFGQVTILHLFTSDYNSTTNVEDRANPGAPYKKLLLGVDGSFYGTVHTFEGSGSYVSALVVKITPQGNLTILHRFGDGETLNDGFGSVSELLQGSDGNFYGMASSGGNTTFELGCVFKVTPEGQYTTIHRFGDGTVLNDGAIETDTTVSPSVIIPGLVRGSDGSIYGTTFHGGNTTYGGTGGQGAIFRISLQLPTLTNFGEYYVGNSFYYDLFYNINVGVPFQYQPKATGNVTEFSAQNLPPGLSINAQSGLVSGTPTTTATIYQTATITLVNSYGSNTIPIDFSVSPLPSPVIESSPVAFGTVGQPFTYTITATNGPNTFSISGFPPGLVCDPNTGMVSGSPTSAGTYTNATITAQNSSGSTTIGLSVQVFSSTPNLGQEYIVLHRFNDGSVANDGQNPTNIFQGFDGTFYGLTVGATAGQPDNTGVGETVFNITAQGTESVLENFFFPQYIPVGLVQGADGNFYGTTEEGGTNVAGTVYELTPQVGTLTLHNFQSDSVVDDGDYPASGVIQGADGNFYGTTENGGIDSNNSPGFGTGVVYKTTPQGQTTILHNFQEGSVSSDGANPVAALVQGTDGNFYGTTQNGGATPIFVANSANGTIGEFTSLGNTINSSLITGLDNPSNLVFSGNDIFVMNSGNGTIGEYTNSGATINASLISGLSGPGGLAVEGKMLFVTNSAAGTIGEYSTSGTTINSTLFTGLIGPTLLASQGPDFVGVAVDQTNLDEIDLIGGTRLLMGGYITDLSDPTSLAVSPVVNGWDIYFTNSGEDVVDYTGPAGTVSLISGLSDPLSLSISSNYLFVANGNSVGEYDATTGMAINSSLLTGLGSVSSIATGSGGGCIFQITPSGAFTTLHRFQDGTVPNDGSGPVSALIQSHDGNFYGTTPYGGSQGAGVVFKMTPGGTVTILHSFADGTALNFDGSVATDGANPASALIEGFDGNFYGMTEYGGLYGSGVVFEMTPDGTVTILHQFGDPATTNDGANPVGALFQGTDGNFYGTTLNGGAPGTGLDGPGYGTVFVILGNLAPQIPPTIIGATTAHLPGNSPTFFGVQALQSQAGSTAFKASLVSAATKPASLFAKALAFVMPQEVTPDDSPTDAWAILSLTDGVVTLPNYLTFDGTTGIMGGYPALTGANAATPGMYNYHIEYINGAGNSETTLTLYLETSPDLSKNPITDNFTLGSSSTYGYQVTVSAYDFPISYSATGLPGWLSIDPNLGYLTGTPPGPGTYIFSPLANNLAGSTGLQVTLTVGPAQATDPVITSTTTATAYAGTNFYSRIAANNMSASVSQGSYSALTLPPGLLLNSATGEILGLPTTQGTYQVPISATNASNTYASVLTLTVGPGPTQPPGLPTSLSGNAVVGNSFSYQVPATGILGSYSANIVGNQTGLPTGLSLNPWTGVISGTPTVGGTYTVNVTATNGAGTSNNATLTITVTVPTNVSFSQWEMNNGIAGELPTDTPGNDGVPNLLKYLCDISNPATPVTSTDRASLPAVGIDKTTTPGTKYLTLTYREYALATGIAVNLQTSSDLKTWTTVTPDLSQQIGTDSGDPIMEMGVVTTGSTQFIRLDVTQP